MSYLDNRTILEKTDLALAQLTAGGGVLQPAQAQNFMRLLIKQSVLMQLATVVPMATPKQQISKIKFGQRILRPGQEATAVADADRVAPDLSSVNLDAKLFKAEIHLSDEVVEDSIERGALVQTITEMMTEAIARDMEELIVNGDTASSDPFIKTMDGIIKQANTSIVNAGGAIISNTLLRDLAKALPNEYLRDKSAMRYLTSVETDLDYRNLLSDRLTVVGDKYLESDVPVQYSGIPVQPVPLFPENLGATNDQTVILLCNPKNIQIGICRQIRIESFRDISTGILKIVGTLRFDARFADVTGVVKAINVKV